MFYTYLYLREDGTPYYVGKGKKSRAFKKQGHTVPLPPTKDRILLEAHASEQDAFDAERFLISYYGRKVDGTGCLRNRTLGGEGLSGFVFTKTHRRRLGEANRNRMIGNTFWKFRTEESIQKLRDAALKQWAAKTDRTQSIETRQRRSKSLAAWWAARKLASSGLDPRPSL